METESLEFIKFGFFSILVFGVTFLAFKSKKQSDAKKEDDKHPSPLKIVKLYNAEGKLLQTYEGVYIKRWEARIYNLYTKKDGKHIIKLDIGANMLLTSENLKD